MGLEVVIKAPGAARKPPLSAKLMGGDVRGKGLSTTGAGVVTEAVGVTEIGGYVSEPPRSFPDLSGLGPPVSDLLSAPTAS